MKRVLIVSENALLCKYLCEKIISREVQVDVRGDMRSSAIKMMAFHPDLVIFDEEVDFDKMFSFLQDKSQDEDTAGIPVIIIGGPIEREKLSKLLFFNVAKYFVMPLKIDLFFDLVGRMLGVKIPIDKTQCVIDIHEKRGIIFVEISQGLNSEKILLTRFHLQQLAEKYSETKAQIVLIMSNIRLSFIDASNLESLFASIMSLKNIETTNIKLLTTDAFVKKLVMGHPLFSRIEILNDLSLYADNPFDEQDEEEEADDSKNAFCLRFLSDFKDSDEFRKNIKVAVVQKNQIDRDDLLKALKKRGYQAVGFEKNVDFLFAAKQTSFDLAVLDDEQKGLTSFDILAQLQASRLNCAAIIYSGAMSAEKRGEFLEKGAKAALEKQNYRCKDVADKIHEILMEMS